MEITVVSPPALLPVTIEEVKEHLNIEDTTDDRLIERLIKAVVASLDPPNGFLGRAMITQTLKYCLPEANLPDEVKLPYPPAQAVVSVVYRNDDEVETEISSETYHFRNDHDPGYVVLDYGETWPTDVSETDPFPFKFTFTAGYGDRPEDVPEDLRLAMMMDIGDYYLNRETILLGQKQPSQSNFLKNLYLNYIWRHIP